MIEIRVDEKAPERWGWDPAECTAEQWAQLPTKNVNPGDIILTQGNVWLPYVLHLAAGGALDPERYQGWKGLAVRYKGELYLWDGAHKAALLWINRWPLLVYIKDLDA